MKLLGLVASILLINTAPLLSSQKRSVLLFKKSNVYTIVQNQQFTVSKGDFIKLDFNIGTVRVMSNIATMFFSRLGSKDGGIQTILTITDGAVLVTVRKFTSKNSYFGAADYVGRSVIAKGTEFYVEVKEGKIITLVETSQIEANNNKGVIMPLNSGNGARIDDNGIQRFKITWNINVLENRTRILSDGKTNIFSGWIEPYMKILVDGVLVDTQLNGYFEIKTRLNYYDVVHPLGLTKRVYPKGAAKGYFGSH